MALKMKQDKKSIEEEKEFSFIPITNKNSTNKKSKNKRNKSIVERLYQLQSTPFTNRSREESSKNISSMMKSTPKNIQLKAKGSRSLFKGINKLKQKQ